MKIPLSWLKEYVDINLTPVQLADALALAGMEVESIQYIGVPGAEAPWDPSKILVGEIKSLKPLPGPAGNLVAEVYLGGERYASCVTGAPGLLPYRDAAAPGLKVAVAEEGALLYDMEKDGRTLAGVKKKTIQGCESSLVLCSEAQLGISDYHEDILILPPDAPPGQPLVTYSGDVVFEFDIKGPFAYYQSVAGIARDTAAVLRQPLKLDPFKAELPVNSGHIHFVDLAIVRPDLCPRYTAVLITGLRCGPSPFRLRWRLRLAGVRPVNNIVDAANYVMLETGQPLHTFDYRKLQEQAGGKLPSICVRPAKPGETIRTLDGEERSLDSGMLVVSGPAGPAAVAGIMGDLDTGVSEATTDVLLEAAAFNFINIRRTAQKLNMRTEASLRYGRGLDPGMTGPAAARTVQLLEGINEQKITASIQELCPLPSQVSRISFDSSLTERKLGLPIAPQEQSRILESLGFQVMEDTAEKVKTSFPVLAVTVPFYRPDVNIPADLLEELGRIYGYGRFPQTRLGSDLPPPHRNRKSEGLSRIKKLMAGCGLDEVITYSIVNREEQMPFLPESEKSAEALISLRNPLSSEKAHLRRSLVPSLLRVVRQNLANYDRVAVFEVSGVFAPADSSREHSETQRLCAVMAGNRAEQSWLTHSGETEKVDFFSIKGAAAVLLSGFSLENRVSWERSDIPWLHPGRSACLYLEGQAIGVVGELHPRVQKLFDLSAQPVVLLDLDVESLLAAWRPEFIVQPVPVFPAVREDLSLVVGEDVSAEKIQKIISTAGGENLRRVEVIDLFRGQNVPAGKKSLTFRLLYQADDHTLTDEETAASRQQIIADLEKQAGAVLRS
jgi:phenylalanyl-tRNA synthetase beta chain